MSSLCKPLLILGILYTAFLMGCAGTTHTVSTLGVTRERPWKFEAQAHQPRVAFVAKGAYLTGLKGDGTYAPGTWVRLMPGQAWPAEEPRPTLVVARVAERTKTTARLEMLAYQAGFRDADLAFEPYPQGAQPAQSLHAMTKRLTFATESVKAGSKSVHIPLTDVELMETSEVYAAFALESADIKKRLASHMRALLTVQGSGEGFTQLQVAAGNLPHTPAFVLMDAPQPPSFQVKIVLSALPNGLEQQVFKSVQNLVNQGIPGSEYIQVEVLDRAEEADTLWGSLGQTCTDTLEVHLLHDGQALTLMDQGFRVHAEPWRVILEALEGEVGAVAVLATAYQMLGYQISAAWLLEQAWQNQITLEARAALAPALALAYHEMERGDWALELALELQGHAKSAKKSTKSVLLTAAAAIYAIVGRWDEFDTQVEKIQLSHLSPAWLRVLAYATLSGKESPKSQDVFASAHLKLTRAKAWTEQDEMFSCMKRVDDDADACSQGVSMASTPFSQAWFETYEVLQQASTEELLARAEAVDRIGAPDLAAQIWLEVLQSGLQPETVLSVWQNAAAYVRKSQQTRQWLHLMAQLVRFMETHALTLPPDALAETVSGWRALDYRVELAALCRLKAQTTSPQEAHELRQFAAELYISIGDHENAAAVLRDIKRP